MSALERYIFRSAGFAFLAGLVGATAVVWLSQTLRSFDLVATKGQSLWTFLFITLLGVPTFALVVAPVARFGATVDVLNRLNTDSELAAMNAAGMRPLSLFKPFLLLTLLVSLAVGTLSLSAIPSSLRIARELLTEIRADIVVNVLREGEFTKLDDKITLHIRRREAGAALTGILIEDNREEGENIVYTAERGQVLETDDGTYLVLENGAMQRKREGEEDATMVVFDRYAFDLSPLTERELVISYKPRELYIAELRKQIVTPDRGANPRRYMAELHERLINPFYPLAFMCIAFAALSRPRSTRQGRMSAIVIAALLIIAVRVGGMGLTNAIRVSDAAIPALYALPLGVSALSLALAFGFHRRLRRAFAGRRPVPA
jgi:lipopolysaccharide export system permease protein